MKPSIKWLLIITASVLVIGSVTGTLLYFFVFQDGGNHTFQSSGFVRAAEDNQIISNAQIQLFGRKEDKSFKLLVTAYSNESGYYSISTTFWLNNTFVKESYFKIVASTNEEIYDHEFYTSLGNYSTDFLLAEIGTLESEGRLFPTRNDSHLTYTFVSVLPLTSNAPRLTATIGCNVSGSALLEIYNDNQLQKSIVIANNDSYLIDLPILGVTIVHSVKLKLIPTDTIQRLWELDRLELTNLVWNQKLNKIAYVITPEIWGGYIYDNFKTIIRESGFVLKHYKQPAAWEPILIDLDSKEDENTIVLLLIAGHGNFIPYLDNGTGDSFVCVNNDTGLNLYSSELKPYIENLESNRIEVIVESCYSGGFIDDLLFDGVTVLTGSDKENPATMTFTIRFFEGINESRMDDMDAFDYSCSFYDGFWAPINMMPQSNWGSWHSFYYP